MVPKVSIVVPVYNSENYISNCLYSIINQTYSKLEIIIVNDGSNDKSEQIILEFKEKDNRIIYLYQNNRGPSEARNKGIKQSMGEYLVFIDSDDTVDEKYIEILLNGISNSNADIVCCGYKDYSYKGVTQHIDFDFIGKVSSHSFMEMVCNGTGGVLWSKIFKNDIIDNFNLKMNKNIYMCEDLVFVLQYARHCKSFVSIKQYLYNYNRYNQNSISSNITIDYIENYIAVWRELERIYNSEEQEKLKSKEIISRKIQEVILKLIEQQSARIKEIGMKPAYEQVQEILDIDYIKAYKDSFFTENYLYKPFIFFIKINWIRAIVIYGAYLKSLREIKKKISRREK